MTKAINIEELKLLLRENVVTVTFTKVSGETRVMKCTLKGDMIPEQAIPTHADWRRSDSVCSVWDLESNGWRSFRVENVIDYKL